jgi:hypothetical protein
VGFFFLFWAGPARDLGRPDSARHYYKEVFGLLPKRGLPAISGLRVGLNLDEIAGFYADCDSADIASALHRRFGRTLDSMYTAIGASGDLEGLPGLDVVGGYMHVAEHLWAVDRELADSLAIRATQLAERHFGPLDHWTLRAKEKRLRLLADRRDPEASDRLSEELTGTLRKRDTSSGRNRTGHDRGLTHQEWISREIERVENHFPPSRQISRGGRYPVRRTPPWGDYGERVLSERRSRCEYQSAEEDGSAPGIRPTTRVPGPARG